MKIIITFVVRLKNGTTFHYIDLPEKITRDELVKIIVHMGGKEEDIIGIYNSFGEALIMNSDGTYIVDGKTPNLE